MKTLKFFVLLFVAVAMSCNFVACGGGDKENGEIVQPGGNGGSDEGNDDPNGNENDPDDPDDGTIHEKLLIGTWQATLFEYYEIYGDGNVQIDTYPMEEGEMTIVFYKDYTLKVVGVFGESDELEESVGSWNLEGDILEIILSTKEQGNLRILELTETSFRYEGVHEWETTNEGISYETYGIYTLARK